MLPTPSATSLNFVDVFSSDFGDTLTPPRDLADALSETNGWKALTGDSSIRYHTAEEPDHPFGLAERQPSRYVSSWCITRRFVLSETDRALAIITFESESGEDVDEDSFWVYASRIETLSDADFKRFFQSCLAHLVKRMLPTAFLKFYGHYRVGDGLAEELMHSCLTSRCQTATIEPASSAGLNRFKAPHGTGGTRLFEAQYEYAELSKKPWLFPAESFSPVASSMSDEELGSIILREAATGNYINECQLHAQNIDPHSQLNEQMVLEGARRNDKGIHLYWMRIRLNDDRPDESIGLASLIEFLQRTHASFPFVDWQCDDLVLWLSMDLQGSLRIGSEPPVGHIRFYRSQLPGHLEGKLPALDILGNEPF